VLYDHCHHDNTLIRARALFFTIIAIGGIRFADAQNIVSIEMINDTALIMQASRFKCSQGDQAETITMPAIDYKGRSLALAVASIKAQMGKSYLLADMDLREWPGMEAPIRKPKRRATYQHCILMLHRFVDIMAKQIEAIHDHPCKGRTFEKSTMHSLRAWLTTVARQVKVPDREVDELLHWNMKQMQRLYHRGRSGEELGQRVRIVRLLCHPTWYSVGDIGRLSQPPPDLNDLPLLPNENITYRF